MELTVELKMNKRLPELPASVSQKEVKTRQSSGKSPLKPKLSRTSTKSITSVHGGGRPRNHDERVQTITEGTNQVEMKVLYFYLLLSFTYPLSSAPSSLSV